MNYVKMSLLIAICLSGISVKAQTAYIAKDSTIMTGKKLISDSKKDNANRIKVVDKKGEVTNFYPDEISEYGLKSGEVYISKKIDKDGELKNYFLRREARGHLTLFSYYSSDKPRFFIEKDSSLFELVNTKEESYKQVLEELTDHDNNFTDQLKVVKFRNPSLTKFVSDYNAKNVREYKSVRWYASVGFAMKTLHQDVNDTQSFATLDNITSSSVRIGIARDVPINMGLNSIYFDFAVSRSVFSGETREPERTSVLLAENITSEISVLLRFATKKGQLELFTNFGPNFQYRIDNQFNLYQVANRPYGTDIERLDQEGLFAQSTGAIELGFGLRKKIVSNNFLSFETRYGRSLFSNQSFSISQFSFLISYSI